MSDIKDWSNTAASNNSAAPDGFPEGMNPSDVNNAAREVMAAVRRQHEDSAWIDLGDSPTQTSATQFTISGDVTTAYAVGRRIRCTDASTLYGEITASSYSNPDTTVTVSLDSGSLSVSLSAVALSVITSEANGGAASGDVTVSGDLSVTGAATVSGAFTSLGIDDNATSEMLQIADHIFTLGSGLNDMALVRGLSTSNLTISGGTAGNSGSAAFFYGPTHATLGNDLLLKAGGNTFFNWDESTGTLTISTGSGAKTTAISLDSSQNMDVAGDVTGSTINADGDTSAGDNAAMGYTASEGLILTGQGSTNDVTIKNDADADVITIATGGTNVDVVGDLTAATINADGDTSAGDSAAMGYTVAEGLILTGQGSTNDVTVKNDADEVVARIPTGTKRLVGSAGNDIDSGQYAIKTSDESVSASTTLQDDDDLQITLEASSTYRVFGMLRATADNLTPDLKYVFQEPDGAYQGWVADNSASAVAESSTIIASLSTGILPIWYELLVTTAGAGGTFKLTWAQNTSDAGNTTVQAGSWMRAVKLA